MKGISKYAVYIFICGWMFFLGIIVGRGYSPVTFDTGNFHERLAELIDKTKEEKRPKISLEFYDALNQPKITNVPDIRVKQPGFLITKKWKSAKKDQPIKPSAIKQEEPILPAKKEPASVSREPSVNTTVYTIQVASFQSEKDAANYVTFLKEKGFSPVIAEGVVNGISWHRVRIGSFSDRTQAENILNKLKKAEIKNIKPIIIKKE